MSLQAHIPAGKTVLHLYTVHLGLNIVSQTPPKPFLGVSSGMYFRILAQDVILIKSDGTETTVLAHHLQGVAVIHITLWAYSWFIPLLQGCGARKGKVNCSRTVRRETKQHFFFFLLSLKSSRTLLLFN